MIKHFEGFERCPKPDPIGLPTVGYGHLCKKNDPECKRCFTEPQAAAFLVQDLKSYESCVQQYLGNALMSKMTAAQYASMVSFTFNLGCGAFQKSSFLKRVKSGQTPSAIVDGEFGKYVNAGGRVFAGLVRRRREESSLMRGQGQYAARCTGPAVAGSNQGNTPQPPKPVKSDQPKPSTPVKSNPKAPEPAKTNEPKRSEPAKTSKPGYESPPQSGASCTASVNNVNVNGKCMPSAACTGSSLSVPWFCPGAGSNECCVQVAQEQKDQFAKDKPYLGSSCTAQMNGIQAKGTCRYLGICANDGQTSVPGSCPGSGNVQCCVGKTNQPEVTQGAGNPAPSEPTKVAKPAPAPSTPASGPKPVSSPKPSAPAPKAPTPNPAPGNDAVAAKIQALPKSSGPAFEDGRDIGQISLVTLQSKAIKVETAVAYEKMRIAAQKEGNNLQLISGFRTMAHQKQIFALYKSGRGPLAAKPGFSYHQNGVALDLNPEVGNNYRWLAKNGATFGFCRTVPSERWHWEFRPVNKSRCIRA